MSAWQAYVVRLALKTGRPVAEVDREEGQRILRKIAEARR